MGETVKILLATLCLNEIEHLPYLYAQHQDWPNVVSWVFVESADVIYAKTNPDMVSPKGLSYDGTSQYLNKLASEDSRVTYIPYGLSKHNDPAQGKVAARQQYLNVANELKPDFVIVVDADEYYTKAAQKAINKMISSPDRRYDAFLLRQRHVWRPKSIQHLSLFGWEVVGGYWSVPHCRIWRWSKGLHYSDNHNTPCDNAGRGLDDVMQRCDRMHNTPECIHLGFASSCQSRHAKHQYYVARGEGSEDGRQWYVDCREASENWIPGNRLPHGASVIPYNGSIPEVFKQGMHQ